MHGCVRFNKIWLSKEKILRNEKKNKTMFTAEDYSRINKQNSRIAFLESSKMILDLGSRYATT